MKVDTTNIAANEETQARKYEVIPPEVLFKSDWIQIPVKPVIRSLKQSSYSTYSFGSKYSNANIIPRLFWFPKSATLYDVFREIIT